MSLRKNILGAWGAELSDEDYACALAGLALWESIDDIGAALPPPATVAEFVERRSLFLSTVSQCLAGERTIRWGRGLNTRNNKRAYEFAEIWNDVASQHRHTRFALRLAVSAELHSWSDLFDFDSLCAWLCHPAVRLGALIIEPPQLQLSRRVRWHWPLRVGVLDDPLLTYALDVAELQRPWIGQLTRRVDVGGTQDACDLLLTRSADLDARLIRGRTRARASVIACLDDPHPDVFVASDRYRTLASKLGCAGIAWVGRLNSPNEIVNWFEAVMREISHDVPIATALSMTGGQSRPRWIVGHAPSLDLCRVLSIADRQDRTIVKLGGLRSVSDLDLDGEKFTKVFLEQIDLGRTESGAAPESAADDGIDLEFPRPPGPSSTPSPLRRLFGNLADRFRQRKFTAETEDGVRSIDELQSRESILQDARPRRWIQAQGWRPDAPELEARSFAERQWNLLSVHIGPTDAPRIDASFPSAGLDFSQGDISLTVQVELAGASLQSIVTPVTSLTLEAFSKQTPPPDSHADANVVGLCSSSILLPSLGNSTFILIGVYPHKEVHEIVGRVAIIHGNRVLQAARVSVPVSDRVDVGDGVSIVTDQVIYKHDDDLDERREYDVAIRVSDVGGKLHLAIQRDEQSTPVELGSLETPIEAIRSALKDLAEKFDYSKPMLDQAVFHERFYTLAARGKALEMHLRKFCGSEIARWERIHLAPYSKEFFPLEYVYEGPSPQVGARVCPNATGALKLGSCDVAVMSDGSRVCPNQRDKRFVCPMRFWGLNRLIERSGVPQPSADLSSTPPRQLKGAASKQPYGKVSGVLYAASDRAFKYVTGDAEVRERAELCEALSALCKPIPAIRDWDEWRAAAARQPNLLVLVVHAEKQFDVPVLEIGDRQFLGSHEIVADITGSTQRPLLVMLLGCAVAGVHENFQPYPELFCDAGADIVLAPISLIRGQDAVSIAKRLAALLAQRLISSKPTTFGELLPVLRRELLSQGHPGVLGLVGFGDGDWILGGRDAAN